MKKQCVDDFRKLHDMPLIIYLKFSSVIFSGFRNVIITQVYYVYNRILKDHVL